jgi:hypothetical protein
MIFRPECHGFDKSAFVMVIKGYNFFRFVSASGFNIKFQATTYPLPPLPSHLILSVMKSNILPFQEVFEYPPFPRLTDDMYDISLLVFPPCPHLSALLRQ